MARTFWANQSAIGRRLRPHFDGPWWTVVGVIADVKTSGIQNPTGPELYLPLNQIENQSLGINRNAYVVIRSAESPATVVRATRLALNELDPALPLAKVRTMEQVMSAAQSRPRFLTLLLTLFSSVALALAAVGIYGVISYAVAQRTKEFGLRMAMGARRADVIGIVLRRGMSLGAVGVVFGLAGALVLTRFLSSLLFGISATDPLIFISMALVLGAVALVASYIPARRATKVDPMVALRYE
jgi:predicted lysophospholipase L1 biosynthesis ABC-type transport system permease subunit